MKLVKKGESICQYFHPPSLLPTFPCPQYQYKAFGLKGSVEASTIIKLYRLCLREELMG